MLELASQSYQLIPREESHTTDLLYIQIDKYENIRDSREEQAWSQSDLLFIFVLLTYFFPLWRIGSSFNSILPPPLISSMTPTFYHHHSLFSVASMIWLNSNLSYV